MDSEGNWSLDALSLVRRENSIPTGTWGESLKLDKLENLPVYWRSLNAMGVPRSSRSGGK